jgi:hypothetical protein
MGRPRVAIPVLVAAGVAAVGVWALGGTDGVEPVAPQPLESNEVAGAAPRPIEPAPVVRGVVVSPDGLSVGRARVWTMGGDRRPREVRAEADGSFRADGHSQIAALPEHSFGAPEIADWTPAPIDGASARIVAPARNGVTVRVVDSGSAEVHVWLSTGNETIGRGPDPDGLYRFWNVPRTSLFVTARASDGRAGLLHHFGRGSVAAPSAVEPLVLELKPGASIEGSVTLAKGLDAASLRIAAWTHGAEIAGDVRDDGSFTIRGLVPAQLHRVVAAAGPEPGFEASTSVHPPIGDVRLELRPKPR